MTETEDGRCTPDADSENSLLIYDSNLKAQYILQTDWFKTNNYKFYPQNVSIGFSCRSQNETQLFPTAVT